MRFPGRKALTIGTAVLLAAVGTQVAAAGLASAHTPSAGITCTTWSIGANSYDAAEANTYSYSIDGATAVTGTFATSFGPLTGTFPSGSGNHTLVGYVYENNNSTATYSHNYNLSTSGCVSNSIPIPVAPVPTPATCTTPGTATIPADTATVHWTLTGDVATATAQGADHFADGTTTQTFTEHPEQKLASNSDACATTVTAAAPVFTDGTCTIAPALTGAVGGTGYSVIVTGTPAFGATVTVTFAAEANYRLTGQSVYSFTFAAAPDCRTSVTEVNPTVTQGVCDHSIGIDSRFSIVPAVTDHITYVVNGLVVTATAATGYKLTPASGWVTTSDSKATYTVVLTAAPICITATGPRFSDASCSGTGPTTASYTIQATPGIDYYIGNATQVAGVHPAAPGSTVSITAQPQTGYVLTGQTTWTHTYPGLACAIDAASSVVGPNSLASTGTPVSWILLVGIALALMGTALTVGGTRRRATGS